MLDATPNPDTPHITPSNVVLYEELLGELKTNLMSLAQMTRRYPVEYEFKMFRFVFESKADIERVIAEINTSLQQFRAHGSTGSNVFVHRSH